MFKAIFRPILEKATEECSPGEHRHWECINTHCSHLKTNF